MNIPHKNVIFCCVVIAGFYALGASDNHDQNPADLYATLRTGDQKRLKSILKQQGSANSSDYRHITALMSAAEVGSVDEMRILISLGADVNAQNSFGATALMWSASDAEKVQLLLGHGADVNKVSKAGRTALIIAALSNPSARTVRMLLKAGADPKAVDRNGLTTLNAAAVGNDVETIRILADAGVDVNAPDSKGPEFSGSTPLMNAARNGNLEAVRLLLARGTLVNATSSRDKLDQVKNGSISLGGFTPLLLAAPSGPPDLIRTLIDAGADVNAADVRGMTPLMLAVAGDHQNPQVVRMLLAHGADTKSKSVLGETALDWARKFGSASTIEALGGQKLAAPGLVPLSDARDIRDAVRRSVGLLEKSSRTYFASSGCFGCHAQFATSIAVAAARAKRIPVDENAAFERKQQIVTAGGLRAPLFMERLDSAATPDTVLFPLESLLQSGYTPDRLTDYLAAEIAATQWPDGRWHIGWMSRTPIEDGDFTRTALAIRALKAYGPPARMPEIKVRLEKAQRWLLLTEPVTAEDRAMRLVGVASGGGAAAMLRTLAAPILEHQRLDGGWAQRDELASDAYATGMALWALAESRVVRPDAEVFLRGVKFLLATQHVDGSWFVASRAVKLQPYFEGGFPYGHDQWISSMATGWASTALSLALDPR